MALRLKGKLSENGYSSADIYDKTGIYNPSTNQSGWEFAGNGFISDVSTATATITTPDAITLMPSTVVNIGSVYPTLPNFINTPYNISASTLGYNDGKLPDGWYVLNYAVNLTVNGVPTVKVAQSNKIFTGQVCCCVSEMQDKLDADSCGCNGSDEKAWKYLKAKVILSGIGRAAGCNENNRAIEMLKSLQKICRNENCSTCN